MGLLKHLLFWPVTGPKFLIDFSLDQVEGVVHQELTDDSSVKADLLELQLELELGDIDDAEFLRREAELMRRLRAIREWRERLGMGVSGGVVRVAEDAHEADETAADDEAPGGESRGPHVADAGGATVDFTLDSD